MLIKLTFAQNKHEFYLRASDIRTIERDPANILQTLVSTTLITNTGPLTYGVIENPDEIANMVENALSGKTKWIPPTGQA